MRSKAVRNLIILVGLISLVFFGWSYWKNNRDSQSTRKNRKQDLQVFGLLYHSHARARRGPESLEALLGTPGMATYEKENKELVGQIRSGDLMVIWSASLFETEEENEKYLLAYEKQTPEKGGWVIRGNGSVANLSPREYQLLSPLPTDLEPLPQEGSAPDWKRHWTLGRVFSAEYPATPLSTHMELGDIDINRLTLSRYNKRGFYGLSRISSRIPWPKLTKEDFFDQWRENIMVLHRLEGSEPTLISETPIVQDGVAGRQWEFQFGETKHSFHRIFFLSGVGYQASVVIDTDKRDDKDIQRFLGSIRFHKEGP